MKNKALSLLGIFVAFLFLFSACGETEIEKAQNSYDWSNVQPKIFDFSGPTLVSASGQAASIYSVAGRGGSSYEFATIGWGADIMIDEKNNFKAHVTWNQASADTVAFITVVETTHAGLKSDTDTIKVTLTAFCPMTIDDFVSASWTGTETGDSEVDPLNVTFVKGTGNVIIAKASGGIPAFLSKVFTGWGEVFQPGFGNEGDIKLQIDLLTGVITIPLEYWGQTLPGPYDYDQNGSGFWSGCGAASTLSFDMLMDASGWRSSHIELAQN